MPILRETSAGTPSESEMEMESLYSDQEGGEGEKEEKSEVSPHSELVSKKLLMGKSVKPGDKVILTVVKDYGDEVELKYAMEGSEKEPMSEDKELEELAT